MANSNIEAAVADAAHPLVMPNMTDVLTQEAETLRVAIEGLEGSRDEANLALHKLQIIRQAIVDILETQLELDL